MRDGKIEYDRKRKNISLRRERREKVKKMHKKRERDEKRNKDLGGKAHIWFRKKNH